MDSKLVVKVLIMGSVPHMNDIALRVANKLSEFYLPTAVKGKNHPDTATSIVLEHSPAFCISGEELKERTLTILIPDSPDHTDQEALKCNYYLTMLASLRDDLKITMPRERGELVMAIVDSIVANGLKLKLANKEDR